MGGNVPLLLRTAHGRTIILVSDVTDNAASSFKNTCPEIGREASEPLIPDGPLSITFVSLSDVNGCECWKDARH